MADTACYELEYGILWVLGYWSCSVIVMLVDPMPFWRFSSSGLLCYTGMILNFSIFLKIPIKYSASPFTLFTIQATEAISI
jgi:hypothetical protein